MASALSDANDWCRRARQRGRARQRVIAWLPPEAVVGEVAVTDKDGSLRVQVSGRLGDVQIEWRADGEHPDEALDELIVHVRRTPSEVLARAYQGRPRRLAVKPSPGLGSASPSSSG